MYANEKKNVGVLFHPKKISLLPCNFFTSASVARLRKRFFSILVANILPLFSNPYKLELFNYWITKNVENESTETRKISKGMLFYSKYFNASCLLKNVHCLFCNQIARVVFFHSSQNNHTQYLAT